MKLISQIEIKRQISYHTDKFKCNGNVFKHQYRNEERDILISLDYIHQINKREGNISLVILTLRNEETEKLIYFPPNQNKEIKAYMDYWISEEEKYGKFIN